MVAEFELRRVLVERFGHDDFRDGQERVIRALLDGRDALTILPTGGGKSLVYQLTAQFLPGVTVVVSPLLALMRDQVEGLESRGIHVAFVNSTQSESEIAQALDAVREGSTKLLYVTPERFEDTAFMAQVSTMSVSLFVVDEAHSISEWGHSFRPAYLTLPAAIATLRRPTILALTATATPWVRRDIVERLGLREPLVMVRGTDRPNLFLEVIRVEEESQDRRILQQLLTDDDDPRMRGSGIVYTATTRAAQDTAGWLSDWGIPADYYHGQRRKSDRERVQDAFRSGEVRVIAATNAFGMGVDKADVRFVIHRDIPPSLEEYYQQAGRAGRDGESARCTLIYRPGDLGRAAFLAGGGQLTRDEVLQAHGGLLKLTSGSATMTELQTVTGLGRADLARLVDILREQGIAEQRRNKIRLLVADFDPYAIPLDGEAHRRAYERSRLDMMRAYAELRECRRRYVLNYFGEEPDWRRCERCDVDLARPPTATPDSEPRGPFAIDDRVVHRTLGAGVIQRVTVDSLTVLFEAAGYKTLDAAIVQEQGLLQLATAA
ncbi:MAG TPA: RecQ family ATP-dependent DNA helicase [Chloroflexota bacterium]|nr:RecQ family ATP-dependent DNA helicase [Chloroflexota bacterium]